MSHFDKLKKLPSGFVIVASTKNSEYAGIAHQTKPIYGTFPPYLLRLFIPESFIWILMVPFETSTISEIL